MEVLCTSPLVECQVTCMLGLWVLEKASGERPWRTCGWLGPFGSVQMMGWNPEKNTSVFFISSTIQHEIDFLEKSFTKPWHQLEWLLVEGTPGWNRCNLSYPHVLHVFVSAFQEHHGVEDCLKSPCFHPDFLREWDVVASKHSKGGYKLPRLILVEKSFRN